MTITTRAGKGSRLTNAEIDGNWAEVALLMLGAARVCSFAALGLASDYAGKTARVTDIGAHGSFWYSDGTTWGVVGGEVVLERSAVAASAVTGVTVETTVRNITIPAGLLGLNGALEVLTKWSLTNNANSKIANFYLGASVAAGIGMSGVGTYATRLLIENRGSESSQIASAGQGSGFGGGNATWTAPAINTAAATTLSIRITPANAGDSAVLESYQVILRRP